MKLFLYYASHTFKNQLKKIFKSWIVIFILACALIGGIIGFTAAKIGSMVENRAENNANESSEEIIEFDENAESMPEETNSETEPLSEDKINKPFVMFGFEMPEGSKIAFVELVIGAVILLILVMEALSADKSGAKIFLPADVNLLFPSPMKPQAVLMFRLITKMGVLVLLTFYMFVQMPNLTLNLGLSTAGAVSIIIAWGILLIFSMLMQSFLYAYSATKEGRKSRISTGVYTVLGVILAGFLVYYLKSGVPALQAVFGYFNAPASRFVPVIGWLKGFCMYTIEGNFPMAGLMLGLLLLSGAALLVLIYRMKVDFYEDAMAKSEETAALQREVQEKGNLAIRRRKKDRSEKLLRDGLNKGEGANIFFWKTVYNRHRFATLKYFTKTTITYTVLCIGAALLLFFAGKDLPFERFTIVALLMGFAAFYRSLGNPLDQDVRVDWFRLIPESSFRKLMFSLLGGSYNSCLDLLPGLLIAAIILRTPLYLVPAWLLFILSIDAYSTTIATFIDLTVPQHAGRTIKQMVQIMFLYFGLGPIAAVIAITWVFGILPVGLIAATGFNLALSAAFLAFCAVRISPGRG